MARTSLLVVALLCAVAAAQPVAKPPAAAPRPRPVVAPVPLLAERRAPAPAPSAAAPVRALSGAAAASAADAAFPVPLDAVPLEAAPMAAGAVAAPGIPTAAFPWTDRAAYKGGQRLAPISGVAPVAQPAPAVREYAPRLNPKVVPTYVKLGQPAQASLKRVQLLPARTMTLPEAAVLLPAMAKEAKGPVSGVSGAAPTKWDKVKGAFGGRKLL